MDASVSNRDPGESHRGHQNGHAPELVVGNLESFDDSVVAAPAFDPTLDFLPLDVVDAQNRALEEEFRAELDGLDHLDHLDDEDVGVLPGFESLTSGDLDRARRGQGNQVPDGQDGRPDQQTGCPIWCCYADLPIHGDGFDAAPETDIPHRGVEHDIPVRHGGQSIDHAGRAQVSLQVEQDRDLASRAAITLSVVIQGIEHTAWLTPAEARSLHRILGQLLGDATGHD